MYSRVVVFHHPGCAAGQRLPQVGVPHRMPTQQRPPPAVGVASPLVLSLPPGAQGDSLLLPRGLFLLFPGVRHLGPNQQRDFEDRAASYLQEIRNHLLEQGQRWHLWNSRVLQKPVSVLFL